VVDEFAYYLLQVSIFVPALLEGKNTILRVLLMLRNQHLFS
jgi:hypothetical protein